MPALLIMLTARAAATADIKSLHNVYLTPQHKRKGKGGRQPAGDPRLDPNMDPKRAKRILNNRLSAARSKAKQRTAQDVSLAACMAALSLAWLPCCLHGLHGAECGHDDGPSTFGHTGHTEGPRQSHACAKPLVERQS